MDFPALIAEVTERTGYADVASRARVFSEAAEARLNKLLRLADGVVTQTTNASGYFILPVDFARAKMVVLGQWEIFPYPLASILDNSKSGYAFDDGDMLTSWPNSTIMLRYYKRLPPLGVNDTNWLLDEEPELYLYAIMQQVFAFKLDADKAAAAEGMMLQLCEGKRRDDFVRRFSRQAMTITGAEDMS